MPLLLALGLLWIVEELADVSDVLETAQEFQELFLVQLQVFVFLGLGRILILLFDVIFSRFLDAELADRLKILRIIDLLVHGFGTGAYQEVALGRLLGLDYGWRLLRVLNGRDGWTIWQLLVDLLRNVWTLNLFLACLGRLRHGNLWHRELRLQFI